MYKRQVESIACSANHALRDFGMKEATIEEYKVFVGDGVDTLIRRLLRFGGDEACEGFEKVRDRYMEYFKEGCLYNVKPYPGIVATLKAVSYTHLSKRYFYKIKWNIHI